LYKAKSRIVDLNNDGKADIILAGMTNDLVTGKPKFLLYESINGSSPPSFKKTDISSQIEPLKNASIDLGMLITIRILILSLVVITINLVHKVFFIKHYDTWRKFQTRENAKQFCWS
jgi:hypothetical protein